MKKILPAVVALVVFGVSAAASSSDAAEPFTVTVAADFEANGAGTNVDSIAFWDAPDPADSLMFVTSKDSALVEVWQYPYDSADSQLPALRHDCIDNGSNGVYVDQETALLYVSIRRSSNVCVFQLPDLSHVMTITSGVTYHSEPNLAMIQLPSGQKRLYVSDDTVVYVHDPATGELLSQFEPVKGLETMVGDNFDQVLYIPDENSRSGIYAYTPTGAAYEREGASVFGSSTIFDSDEEGIIVYPCPADGLSDNGDGWIVVSDQIDSSETGNDYEVFDRRTWAYLGKIKVTRPGGGFAYNTDGIALTQQASTTYPQGVFAVQHDDISVVGTSWQKILQAAGLTCGAAVP